MVVFCLICLLVDNGLLGNHEPTTSATPVNLGSATSRLDASLETPVASSRGNYVCSFLVLLEDTLDLKTAQRSVRRY